MRKRYFSLIAIALLALPVIAQDDFGGFSQSDLEALVGGGGGGRGGRGGRGGNNIQTILPDATVMYNQLKDLLKNKKVALAKEQEKPLQTLLNDEVKAARADLETQFPALRNLGQPNQNNNNNQNQNQNQNRGNQNNNNQAARVDTVVLEQNALLLADIKKELTPEQVAILDKAEKDKKCVVLIDGHFSFLQNGNRGNGQGQNNRSWCTYGDSTVAQRVAPIRDLMKRERKPLTEAQDAKIGSLVEARLPVLETALRDAGVLNNNNRGGQQNAQNQQNQQQQQRQQIANNIVNQMFQAMGIQTQNNQGGRGGNNFNFDQIVQQVCAPDATQEQRDQAIQQLSQNFGNRGGNTPNIDQLCQTIGNRGGRGGNNLNANAVRVEVEKRNELILDKVVAFLKPEQGSIIKKLKYEQIKSKGGADRIRGILEEEGTPATPEQITQMQNLFNQSNQSLREWTQQFVLKAMETNPPPQQQQQQQQPQNNQNRGNNNNNNQALQQYIPQMAQSLLPQVAKQRAQIEQATMNSVMRILTPAQVASYKINITMPPL